MKRHCVWVGRWLFRWMVWSIRFSCVAVIGCGVFGAEAWQKGAEDQDQTSGSGSTVAAGMPVDAEGIRRAFQQTHDGWSCDEVLMEDTRRESFLRVAREATGVHDERTLLEALMKLRKSGKLQVRTTRRAEDERRAEDGSSEVMPAAEIAARWMEDQYGALVDQVLVDPELRKRFDEKGLSIEPDATPYLLRKGAMRLRKSRRLVPELTLRVVDWKREIVEWSVEEARTRSVELPNVPGVYLFRDETGYLYIGQSNRLRERLVQHLGDSDRKSLSEYLLEHATSPIRLELHVFGEDSPARETRIREAYESELIRSRKPRLNLAP